MCNIQHNQGVILRHLPSLDSTVALVQVLDYAQRFDLPWDRYMRLSVCAEQLELLQKSGHLSPPFHVLDVGGFDGAIALFLRNFQIHLADPLTTGADGLNLSMRDGAYESVISIDVLEHIEPVDRLNFLRELARVTRKFLFINYPCNESARAQEIVAQLSNDRLIIEHVNFGLPVTWWVREELKRLGFVTDLIKHTSTATWASYFTLKSCDPAAAEEVSRYLIENSGKEAIDPLYDLIVAQRISQ